MEWCESEWHLAPAPLDPRHSATGAQSPLSKACKLQELRDTHVASSSVICSLKSFMIFKQRTGILFCAGPHKLCSLSCHGLWGQTQRGAIFHSEPKCGAQLTQWRREVLLDKSCVLWESKGHLRHCSCLAKLGNLQESQSQSPAFISGEFPYSHIYFPSKVQVSVEMKINWMRKTQAVLGLSLQQRSQWLSLGFVRDSKASRRGEGFLVKQKKRGGVGSRCAPIGGWWRGEAGGA